MSDTTHITLTVGQIKGLLPLLHLARLILRYDPLVIFETTIVFPPIVDDDAKALLSLIQDIRASASHSHTWDLALRLNELSHTAEASIPQNVSMEDLRRVLEFAVYGSLLAYYPDEQQMQADVLQILQRDDYRAAGARLFRALSLPFGPPG